MSRTKSTDVRGDVDPIRTEDLRQLASVEGPCVSVFLPTAPLGPGTTGAAGRLRRLTDRAASALADQGAADAAIEEVLGRLRAPLDDDATWQHPSGGLALFCAPGASATIHLAEPLPEGVTVGSFFRLSPLVPLVSEDDTVAILALAQNSVRVLEATRLTVREVPLGEIPGSMEQAIPQDQPERHGQSHSAGRGSQQFHGQGSEADYDKAALERYFRAVDRPLAQRLAVSGELLVLACVSHYLPVYASVSRCPRIWPEPVPGNPEHRSAEELRAAAWDLVAGHFTQAEEQHLDRYRAAAGTGRTVEGPDQVLEAARGGRVDTLLLDAVSGAESVDDVLDAAVVETLRHDGRVVAVRGRPGVGTLAAVLRY